MNTYWIIWLLAILISFTFLEWRAFRWPSQSNTLSRFIHNIGTAFPLSLVFYGMLFGGLAVHFFWNWCPDLGSVNGFLSMTSHTSSHHPFIDLTWGSLFFTAAAAAASVFMSLKSAEYADDHRLTRRWWWLPSLIFLGLAFCCTGHALDFLTALDRRYWVVP